MAKLMCFTLDRGQHSSCVDHRAS